MSTTSPFTPPLSGCDHQRTPCKRRRNKKAQALISALCSLLSIWRRGVKWTIEEKQKSRIRVSQSRASTTGFVPKFIYMLILVLTGRFGPVRPECGNKRPLGVTSSVDSCFFFSFNSYSCLFPATNSRRILVSHYVTCIGFVGVVCLTYITMTIGLPWYITYNFTHSSTSQPKLSSTSIYTTTEQRILRHVSISFGREGGICAAPG